MKTLLRWLHLRSFWLQIMLDIERREFFDYGEPVFPDELRRLILLGGFPTIAAVFERLRTGGGNLFLVSVLKEMAKNKNEDVRKDIELGATDILTDKELDRQEWHVESMIELLALVELPPAEEIFILLTALAADPHTAPEMLVERICAILSAPLFPLAIHQIFNVVEKPSFNPYLVDVVRFVIERADPRIRMTVSLEVTAMLTTVELRKEHWLQIAMLELLFLLELKPEAEARILLLAVCKDPKTTPLELLILLGVFTTDESPWFPEMLEALRDETNAELQEAMSQVFFYNTSVTASGRSTIQAVAVSAENKTVRANLVRVLACVHDDAAENVISRILITDIDPEVRYAAFLALLERGVDLNFYLPFLFDVIHKAKPAFQLRVAFFIASMGSVAIEPLMAVLINRKRSARAGGLAAQILRNIFHDSQLVLGSRLYRIWSRTYFEDVLDCFCRATAQSAPFLCDCAALTGTVCDLLSFTKRKPTAAATPYAPEIILKMVGG